MGCVSSDVGQFLSFISVLIDLSQRPDEARPLVSLRHADLLQKEQKGQRVQQQVKQESEKVTPKGIRRSTPEYLESDMDHYQLFSVV